MTTGSSPYKFLDFYTADDAHLFFGRDRETEILLSDIISTRLVVLFARTGTGKTSLINAAVRPRLEELDYRTLYIRVEQDPTASLRSALVANDMMEPGVADEALEQQLLRAVERLGSPLVVFLDQFEEFFIYVLGGPDPRRGEAFIADMASIFRKRDSGVHLVFSLREDYFVEMDAFRSEIPTIFHANSNLRLLPLDVSQAWEAIVKPAAAFGAHFDDRLVSRIITELAQSDHRVIPSQLQIVCDTLWHASDGADLSVAAYERLGGAQQILDRRFAEDIARLEERQLWTFLHLVPELRTPGGTKYIRGVDELASATGVERTTLADLLQMLKKRGLVTLSQRHGASYVEWASDYLAARSESFEAIVRWRKLRLQLDRVMQSGVFRAPTTTSLPGAGPLAQRDEEALALAVDDMRELSRNVGHLRPLTIPQAEFLFSAALATGIELRLWFEESASAGYDVWGKLRSMVTEEVTDLERCQRALALLGELGTDPAVDLLATALRQPQLATRALELLAGIASPKAQAILRTAVDSDEYGSYAVDVLARRGDGEAIDILAAALDRDTPRALEAGAALHRLASRQPDDSRSRQAHDTLADVLTRRGAPLFRLALSTGSQASLWFSLASESGVPVWPILEKVITDPVAPLSAAENGVRLLLDVRGPEADRLLDVAASHDRTMATASAVTAARRRLDSVRSRPSTPAVDVPSQQRPGGPLSMHAWQTLIRSLQSGRCTVILGDGLTHGVLPTTADIAHTLAARYTLKTADTRDLPSVANLLALQTDRLYVAEALARLLTDATDPLEPARDRIHAVLARIPIEVYIVASYDQLLSDALRWFGRDPQALVLSWRDSDIKEREVRRPSAGSPVVFHLLGAIDAPESLVVTRDDIIDLISSGALRDAVPPPVQYAIAAQTLMLVGFTVDSLPFQVVRTLLQRGERLGRYGIMTLSPGGADPQADPLRQDDDLARYVRSMGLDVYWGTPQEFADELQERLGSAMP